MGVEGIIYKARIQKGLEAQEQLQVDLSQAIGDVLRQYGVTGGYDFSVTRPGEEERITELKGHALAHLGINELLTYLGDGHSTVEDSATVNPISDQSIRKTEARVLRAVAERLEPSE